MNLALSYSSIRTYLDCPLRYKFLYVEKRARATSPAFLLGSAVHAAIEELNLLEQGWLRDASESDPPALEEQAKEAYERQWHIQLEEYQKAVPLGCAEPLTNDRQTELFIRGQRSVSNFLQLGLIGSPDTAEVWVEQDLEVPIGDNGCRLKGVIDKLVRTRSGKHIIFDYKTGTPRSQKATDQDLQLTFYYYLIKNGLEVSADELALVFLEEPAVRRTSRHPEDLASVEELVQSTAAHIEAEQFEPRASRSCPSCEFKCDCPKLVVSMTQIKQFIRCPAQYALADQVAVLSVLEDTAVSQLPDKASGGSEDLEARTTNSDGSPLNGLALFSAVENEALAMLRESSSEQNKEKYVVLADTTDAQKITGETFPKQKQIPELAQRFLNGFDPEALLDIDPYYAADLGSLVITGRLGLLTSSAPQGLTMHQLKTGKEPQRLYEEDRLSTALIVIIAREKLGLDIRSVKNHYVVAGTVREIEPANQDLKDAVQLVKRLAGSVQRSTFRPVKGPACSWCQVKLDCTDKL